MNRQALEAVLARIDALRGEMIAMQTRLTALPAIGPESGGQGEAAKAAYLKGELERLGLIVEDYPAPDPAAPSGVRPNLVARPRGTQTDSRVWILTHTDIVPPGERRLWRHDPFTAVLEGDRLYGRGTEDNQQSMVASIFAVRALLEAGATPGRTPCLALVADEETGSTKGLGYLIDHHPRLFGKDDLIIVPDIGSNDGAAIEVAEKSILWLRLRVLGRQCHASRPELGINTLEATAHLIVALTQALRERFDAREALYEPPESTFCATKKEANVPNINTIPGEDVFYLDSRVLPAYHLDDILAETLRHTLEAERRFGVRVEVSEVQRAQAPPATSPEAPVVKAIAAAVRELRAIEARPIGVGGGTVAAFFRRVGLPAAAWSTSAEVAHQPDEYCIVENMVADAKVFAHVILQA